MKIKPRDFKTPTNPVMEKGASDIVKRYLSM